MRTAKTGCARTRTWAKQLLPVANKPVLFYGLEAIAAAIQWLLDNGRRVSSIFITGYWKDTGNAADMLEVNRLHRPAPPVRPAGPAS